MFDLNWMYTVVLADIVIGFFVGLIFLAMGEKQYGPLSLLAAAWNVLMIYFVVAGAADFNWQAWVLVVMYALTIAIQVIYGVQYHREVFKNPLGTAVWCVLFTLAMIALLANIPQATLT